jgi:hypothetical protein
MIGAIKRISSKFEEGDRVKIAKEYGGGTGKVVQVVGGFVVVKTKRGDESYHSSNLKVISGIGAASDAAYVEYTEKGKKNRLYFSNKIEAMQYVNRLLKTIKKGVYSEVVSSIKIKNAVN